MAFVALRGAALSVAVLGLVALHSAACSNDSGGEHGSNIPTLPDLDGGRRVLEDGGILLPDGAVIAPDDDDDASTFDAGPICASGSGTAVVLAGDATSLTGSVRVNNSAWATQAIAGGAASSKPSLVALGTTFVGTTQGADNSLLAVNYTTTWSTPAAIGVAGVKGSPTMAVVGTTAHVVYAADDASHYYHGIFDGTNWDAASEHVAADQTDDSTWSFGTESAGLAALGTGLAFAENGGDHGLYARTWAPTAWTAAIPVSGAGSVGIQPATPELVAVTGTFDAIIIYADNNPAGAGGSPIAWASHTAGSATWGTPNQPPNEIGPTAQTSVKMASVALSDTSILLSFVTTGEAFYTIGTVSSGGVAWTTPAPVGGSVPIAVDAVPAVAKGICGQDAMFVFSTQNVVKTTSLTLATMKWTAPQDVTGAKGANIALATTP